MSLSHLWNGVIFGGAIMGFLIGAGFASGQEILTFYTHLGFIGSLAGGLFSMLVLAVVFAAIMEDGRKLQCQDTNSIFDYYCGKYLGPLLKWAVAIVMFLVTSIMFSGAGATLEQQYGLAPVVGRLSMAIITILTVVLGLKNLVNVVGAIAPVIAIFAIAVGIAGVVSNPAGVTGSDALIASLKLSAPYPNWWATGFMYAAYLTMGMVPFICGVGAQARTRGEAVGGGIFGSVGFMLGAMALGFGMMAHIQEVHSMEIPALGLLGSNSPVISNIFAVALMLAIYTTAVPMLWTAVNKLAPVDGTVKYRLLTVVLGVIALFGGLFKFSTMVGIVYPALGWIGMLIITCMIWKKIRVGFQRGHSHPVQGK